MKIIDRKILPFQENNFFSPIRDKIDYVRLIAFSARQLLLNVQDPSGLSTSHLRLVVDKMSRLFFYKDNKYFSVSFPLFANIAGDNQVTELTTYSGCNLDSQVISSIISVIDDAAFRTDTSFINFFLNQDDSESSHLYLLEELFQFEPSYIRYDCDPENENGSVHPLHHLDINYSQYGTFKLGLSRGIASEYFEDIQNVKTDCTFLVDK